MVHNIYYTVRVDHVLCTSKLTESLLLCWRGAWGVQTLPSGTHHHLWLCERREVCANSAGSARHVRRWHLYAIRKLVH